MLLARFVRPASPSSDKNFATVRTGGRSYTIAHLPGDATAIRWDEGENSITVAGGRQSVDQLVRVASTAQLVTANEWNAPIARLVMPTRNWPDEASLLDGWIAP